MLLASRRADLMQGYRHPPLLAAAGATVALLMAGLGVYTVITQLEPSASAFSLQLLTADG